MSAIEERLKDIADHPERHRHTFNGLRQCCLVKGAVDLRLMEAHTGPDRRCDVISGPCACGASHR